MPRPSTTEIEGASSFPAEGLSDVSITSTLLIPVSSSVLALTVTPSTMSVNLIFPLTSEIIGRVYGSHPATFVPGSIFALSFTNKVDP